MPAHAEKRHGDKPRDIVGSSSSAAKAAGGADPKNEGSENDVGGVAAGSTGGPYTIGRTGGAPVHVAGVGLVMSPAPAETRQGGARIQGPHHAQNPPPTKKRNTPYSVKRGGTLWGSARYTEQPAPIGSGAAMAAQLAPENSKPKLLSLRNAGPRPKPGGMGTAASIKADPEEADWMRS